jgi:uncharacterized Zn finger protein
MDTDSIIPAGRRIAESWWGRAWVSVLEGYADFSNRMPRGRSYLRNGAVRDILISEGHIEARVQGRMKRPYRIIIDISPLPGDKISEISARCSGRIESLDALVTGNIPSDIAELFVSKGGLFPTPEEIYFDCSCPDSAYMCKHVAAVLYGIAVMFDREPLLFFRLRGINVDTLVRKSVEERTEKMLRNAGCRTGRMLDDREIKDTFGIL